MDHSIDSFNYNGCQRDAELNLANSIAVGVQFLDGIMIGVDTRINLGNSLIGSNSKKVFKLHDNVFCGGIGLMEDITKMTTVVTAQLKMLNRCTNRQLPVDTARHLMKTLLKHNQGKHMASYIVGGVDGTGIHLYSLHRDGNSEELPYSAMGEGMSQSIKVLENRWKAKLTENDAHDILMDAITAGAKNDPSTEFKVDICIIRQDYSVEHCTEAINESSRSFKPTVEINITKTMEVDSKDEVFHGEATVSFPPIDATVLLALISGSLLQPSNNMNEQTENTKQR